jgi:hypothetical protein
VTRDLRGVENTAQAAAAQRSAVFSPATASALLPQASQALTCEWVVASHAKLEEAICLEVRESWALLAMLLPLCALVLLLDAAIHHRFLIGTPPVHLTASSLVPAACVRAWRRRFSSREELEAKLAAARAAEAARLAELEEARLLREAQERAERQWQREQKRQAKPRVGGSDFGAAFMDARVAATERAKHFASTCPAAVVPPRPKPKCAWPAAAAPPETASCFD